MAHAQRPQRQPAGLPQPSEGFAAVGLVRGAHGVAGELKITPLTDFPERFRPGATVWAAGVPRNVRRVRAQHDSLLLTLEGIDTREHAAALRGALLEVPEADLAPLGEHQYYRHDIVGLAVFDAAGRSLGRVDEVLDTGANDVYIVRDGEGELLLPAIDAVIKDVDLSNGRMVVELIPGLERRPLRARQSSKSEGSSSPS